MRHFAVWIALVVCSGIMLNAAPAQAQATRTWVSGVGDDANPCSRTAPCKTFAGAISKTTTGGEIDALDPGGFGGVTISKAITIDGGFGNTAGVLVSGTNGITINAPAGTVVILRNLDINGLGNGLSGVNFVSGASLHVENTKIYGFATAGITFAPSAAEQTSLLVASSVITDNPNGGIVVQASGGATVAANFVGVISSRNKFGLHVSDGVVASVQDSVFNGNTNNGVIAASSSGPCEINVERSLASNNSQYGVVTSGAGAIIRISQVGIFDNGTGIAGLSGGQVISFGNNQNTGNATNGGPTSTIANQ